MNSYNKVDEATNDSTNLARLKLAIAGITPDRRHRVATCFAEAFPDLEVALAQRKSMKVVLASFNQAYDLNVSPQTFRKMVTDASQQLSEAA